MKSGEPWEGRGRRGNEAESDVWFKYDFLKLNICVNHKFVKFSNPGGFFLYYSVNVTVFSSPTLNCFLENRNKFPNFFSAFSVGPENLVCIKKTAIIAKALDSSRYPMPPS